MSERDPHNHYTISTLEHSLSLPIENSTIPDNYSAIPNGTELKTDVEVMLIPESRIHNLPDPSIFRQYPKPQQLIPGIDPSLQRDRLRNG